MNDMDNASPQLDKIIIIDDAQLDRFVAQKLVERQAIAKEVIAFSAAADALEHLKENTKPDLIFLDINMPEMNGFQFLEAYSSLPDFNNVTVMMLTSSVSPDDQAQSEKYACVKGFIQKPLSQAKLEEAVSKVDSNNTP